jgi:hypothetical protein
MGSRSIPEVFNRKPRFYYFFRNTLGSVEEFLGFWFYRSRSSYIPLRESHPTEELCHQDWGAPSPSPGSIVGGEETQEEREEEIE